MKRQQKIYAKEGLATVVEASRKRPMGHLGKSWGFQSLAQ